ncbi:MAG: sugar transferase [bacterium]
MKTKKTNHFFLKFLELSIDFLILIISFDCVLLIQKFIETKDLLESFQFIFGFGNPNGLSFLHITIPNLFYIFISSIFFVIYKTSILKKKIGSVFFSLLISILMTNATLVLLYFLFGDLIAFDIKSSTFIISIIAQVSLLTIHKIVFAKMFRSKIKKFAIIYGPKEEVQNFAIKFLKDGSHHKRVQYLVFEEEEFNDVVYKYIDNVDEIYITPSCMTKSKNNIVSYCITQKYISVFLVPQLYEIGIIKSKTNNIDDTLLFEVGSLHFTLEQRFIKRSVDLIASLIGIILASPLIIFAAIAIKINDRGSVFFKQERVGINGKKFMLYKFRSMIENAEAKTGAIWAQKNDNRITKLGKFLRTTRIDELPQLFNVLKGEMSLIGPRPEREIFINEFIQKNPNFEHRTNVKPGITGLAQTVGKYDTDPMDKLRYDLLYIRKYNIFQDFLIILLTIKTVFDKDSTRGVEVGNDLNSLIYSLGLYTIDNGSNIEIYKNDNKEISE